MAFFCGVALARWRGPKIPRNLPIRLPRTERTQTRPHHAYLGITVEPLHRAFALHLPDALIPGQGVLVRSVMKGSPADKAGIKENDILATYGDQKLFSAEQLIKLVGSDKPHHEMKLGIVRQGHLQELTVTLGEENLEASTHHAMDRWHMPWWDRDWFVQPFANLQSGASSDQSPMAAPFGEKFEALSVTRLDDQHFKLDLRFTGKDGKTQNREFTGTRDEIRRKLNQDKSVPTDERQYALRSLESGPTPVHYDLPGRGLWRRRLRLVWLAGPGARFLGHLRPSRSQIIRVH